MSVNLSIKGVPEPVAERLRARAERNHRSLQGELMAIIEQASDDIVNQPRALDALSRLPQRKAGWKTIEDLVAERQHRASRHVDGVPLAVDIVRADRDRR
jgi:antitoxin FitA